MSPGGAPDGAFVMDSPSPRFLVHETGNVFLGDEPAAVSLQAANLSAAPVEVALEAAVADLGGSAHPDRSPGCTLC